jgi:5-methylcytosine-specific restriction endonuclease McrA
VTQVRRVCLCGRLQPCELHPRRVRRRDRQWRKLRAAVLLNATRCHLCGKPATDDDPLVVDHVVPLIWGGTDDESNLRAAHASCNNSKGGALPRGGG